MTHVGGRLWIEALDHGEGVDVGGVAVQRGSLPLRCAFMLGGTRVRVGPEGCEATLPGMVGGTGAMDKLARSTRRLAQHPVPVLVRGETGTGKELVAKALHACGPRRDGPFVAINAAALSQALSGSELFGHRRGAFTGAHDERKGAFLMADGGTLFLDEVASLPAAVQAHLLRVVEEGKVVPLGSDRPVPIDVRLVSATCEPLERMVATGAFRADLYERLATCVLRVPPLRERLSDIPALCACLLDKGSLPSRTLSPEAFALLKRQRWPGNVRELRNVLVQASVDADGETIGDAVVASVLRQRGLPIAVALPSRAEARALLAAARGNVSAAARRAGLPRSTFRDLVGRKDAAPEVTSGPRPAVKRLPRRAGRQP